MVGEVCAAGRTLTRRFSRDAERSAGVMPPLRSASRLNYFLIVNATGAELMLTSCPLTFALPVSVTID